MNEKQKQSLNSSAAKADLVMNSMLKTIVQSERDSELFWDGVKGRIDGRVTHTTSCDASVERIQATCEPVMLARFHIGVITAAVAVAALLGTTFLHLKSPDATSVTAKVKTETLLSPDNIQIAAEFDAKINSSAVAIEVTAPDEDYETTIYPTYIDVDESTQQTLQSIAKNTCKSSFPAHIFGQTGYSKVAKKNTKAPNNVVKNNEEQISRTAPKDAIFPPTHYLNIEIEFNKSGYGRVAINRQITTKRIGPNEVSTALVSISDAICERVGLLGPRIGLINGVIRLEVDDKATNRSFESIDQIRKSIAGTRKQLAMIKSNYRPNRNDSNPAANCANKAIQRINSVFQTWAQENTQLGDPVIRIERDKTHKFTRFISKDKFVQFANKGYYQLLKPSELYTPETKLQDLSSIQLKKQLASLANEIELFKNVDEFSEFSAQLKAAHQTINNNRRVEQRSVEPLKELVKERDDLKGLPLVMGKECHLERRQSQTLQTVSQKMGPSVSQFNSNLARRSQRTSWSRDATVMAFANRIKLMLPNKAKSHQELLTYDQILQTEHSILKMQLINLLERTQSKVAANLLCCYAKYDLDSDVRMAATKALSKYPASDYRENLLRAFDYPWPAAAKHSAEAIVRLNDVGASPELVEVLVADDPRGMRETSDGQFVKHELVSINHMKNCMLCHADSNSHLDHGRAPVPQWDQPLPSLYYNSRPRGLVARADVTYLRQDFSVFQDVEDHGPWPTRQRFDYVVRKTPVSQHEQKQAVLNANDQYDSEYRDAAVFALRLLTDQQPNNDSYKTWKTISEQSAMQPSS